MKLGTVPPGKSGSFYFSPPGSSNLPVRIFWEGKAGSRLEEKSGKVRTAEQILAERLARKEHKGNSTKRK